MLPRLFMAAITALVLYAAPGEAAVSVQSVETTRGTIPCWLGDDKDNVITDAQVNCLIGRSGSDRFYGNDGRDLIDAEDTRRDYLSGGKSIDTFYVGPGAFLWDTKNVDLILDMEKPNAAGLKETICTRSSFPSWYATKQGTSGKDRFIVVRSWNGAFPEEVIAWVKNFTDIGAENINVKSCYLRKQ